MRELYFSVDSSWSKEGRIQDINSVGSHDDLDGLSRLEAVELVEQLEHSSLHF